MEFPINGFNSNERGIRFRIASSPLMDLAKEQFSTYLQMLGIDSFVEIIEENVHDAGSVGFQIHDEHVERLAPDGDTAQLCQLLNLDTIANLRDLERETVWSDAAAWMAAPAMPLPSGADNLAPCEALASATN